uniref:ribonuclease H n=1 Tax=Apteryx owenii TaxID=8824 RepID=A0A8B9P6H8_APTOW
MANIEGQEIPFSVDTGATLSLLNFEPKGCKSSGKITIQGVMGKGERMLTKALLLTIGGKGVWGRFIISMDSPFCLLGRDLLQALDTRICLQPEGMKLILMGSCVLAETPEPESTNLQIPAGLESVPGKLWSSSGMDVGLLKSASAVSIKTKGGLPPVVKQYPIPKEAEQSIQKQIDHYLKLGILRVCEFPYNTLILPVKKNRQDSDGDPEYCFVQELRVINQHVIAPHPVVPGLSTILLEIPYWATYFTVINVTAAFFSIPVAEDSQDLFAFTWKGQQLTCTRLPQGFTRSPTIFSRILKNDLADIELPGCSVLIQYVDDLLLASKDYETCLKDTISLCNTLAEKGH